MKYTNLSRTIKNNGQGFMVRDLFIFSLILGLSLALSTVVLAQTEDLVVGEDVEAVPTLYDDTVAVEPIIVEGGDTVSGDGEELPIKEVVGVDNLEGEVQDEIIIGGLDSLDGKGDDGLVDFELSVPDETPGNWGLFWRGVRERVSVAVTFDPVKKAEKQLKFAEERMLIAEKMAESDNEKIQARAEKMIEKAQGYMEKVEARKDKWLENKDERVQKLLQNVATHQVRREGVLDRIEARIPEDKMEKWQEMREKTLEGSHRLLGAIENENIPEKVKEHLQGIKIRVEEHLQEVKQFNEQKRELKQAVKEGVEDAKIELQQLHEQRQEILQQRKNDFEHKKEELKTAAEAGDKQAQRQLKMMGAGQMIKKDIIENKLEKRQENLGEKIEVLKEKAEDGDLEARKRLEQANRAENRVENRLENIEEGNPLPPKPLPNPKPLPKPGKNIQPQQNIGGSGQAEEPPTEEVFDPGGWGVEDNQDIIVE